MPQRALRPQLAEQALRFLKRLLVELSAVEQPPPTLVNLLFRKQSKPPWVKNREVSSDPSPGCTLLASHSPFMAVTTASFPIWSVCREGLLPRLTKVEDLVQTE